MGRHRLQHTKRQCRRGHTRRRDSRSRRTRPRSRHTSGRRQNGKRPVGRSSRRRSRRSPRRRPGACTAGACTPAPAQRRSDTGSRSCRSASSRSLADKDRARRSNPTRTFARCRPESPGIPHIAGQSTRPPRPCSRCMEDRPVRIRCSKLPDGTDRRRRSSRSNTCTMSTCPQGCSCPRGTLGERRTTGKAAPRRRRRSASALLGRHPMSRSSRADRWSNRTEDWRTPRWGRTTASRDTPRRARRFYRTPRGPSRSGRRRARRSSRRGRRADCTRSRLRKRPPSPRRTARTSRPPPCNPRTARHARRTPRVRLPRGTSCPRSTRRSWQGRTAPRTAAQRKRSHWPRRLCTVAPKSHTRSCRCRDSKRSAGSIPGTTRAHTPRERSRRRPRRAPSHRRRPSRTCRRRRRSRSAAKRKCPGRRL